MSKVPAHGHTEYDELLTVAPSLFMGLRPRRPLTIREQYRLRRARLSERLHDLLFPHCSGDDR